MLEIYQTAHNLIKNNIWGWQYSVRTNAAFADKLTIVVNESQDGTREAIEKELSGFNNWQIIDTKIPTSDCWFDGKLKNIGLQACLEEFKLQLDMDETPYGSRNLWDNILFQFKFSQAKCLAIGSINMFKDWSHHYGIYPKQYLSKGTDCFRGPQIRARRSDGSINTQISDGCDLILADGTFAPTEHLPNDQSLIEEGFVPAIVHFGYVNLQSRIDRNKEFWAEHWFVESNGTPPAHKIHMTMEDFDQPYLPITLDLPDVPKL